MRTRTWILCAAAAILALACGPAQGAVSTGPQTSEGPRSGGVLNMDIIQDAFNWDITISKTNPNDNGIALGYNSLLGFKYGPDVGYTEMVLQPELAERWEISPDARTFTFHLRQGVKYHKVAPVNGRELTSADFRFAAEYRLRTGEFKEKKIPQAEIGYIFEGLERVDTPDNYTVMYRFKEPFVPFINYAASDWNPALPREIYDRDGHFQDAFAGTGPFMLDVGASQKGTRWVFKKNPDYWEKGKPYLDEIRWLLVNNESAGHAAFQTKQLDLLDRSMDFEEAETLRKGAPGAEVFKYVEPRANQMYVSMKPERNGPMRDLRVRKAVSLAIDRDEINRTLFGGGGEWGLPAAMHGLFTEAEVKQIYKHDPAEARQLVVEAGYGNGVNLEWPVPTNEDQTNLSMIELMQAQLKKVGLNIVISFIDRPAQRLIRRSSDFDLDMGFGLGGLHDDPESLAMARYLSTSKNNYSVVRDPDLDKLLLAQRAESNLEKRRELLRSITKRIADNHYTIELLYRPKWVFWHPHVKNYKPHFGSQASYAFAWLDK